MILSGVSYAAYTTVGSYSHVVVEPYSDQSFIELESLYFCL